MREIIFNYGFEIILLLLLFLVIFSLWLNKDPEKKKFNWIKLVPNEYNITFLSNDKKKYYNIDFIINTEHKNIKCVEESVRKCTIFLPKSITNKQLSEFVSKFNFSDKIIDRLVKGIYLEDRIYSLKLSRADTLNYREFVLFLTKTIEGKNVIRS